MRKLILATSMFLFAQSAYSFVNAEAFYGKRWYDSDGFRGAGDLVSLGLNLDPIPLAPVSAGLAFAHTELKASDFHLKNASHDELLFNVKAWIPFVPVVTPYARISVPLVSRLHETPKGSNKTINSAVHGYDVGVGLEYGIFPLVDLQIELRESYAKNTHPQKMNSHILLFGLTVGI